MPNAVSLPQHASQARVLDHMVYLGYASSANRAIKGFKLVMVTWAMNVLSEQAVQFS